MELTTSDAIQVETTSRDMGVAQFMRYFDRLSVAAGPWTTPDGWTQRPEPNTILHWRITFLSVVEHGEEGRIASE